MPRFEPPVPLEPGCVPQPIAALLAALRGDGHRAVLVGGCVRDLLRGRAVTDFDVATSAPPETVLALFPRAIPTGLRHGTVMVPTSAGPVDVTTFRGGPRLEDDLAHRDFTVNALAWDPAGGDVHDPFGGIADLQGERLRAVRSAKERLREDPVRAVRAARLVAQLGLRADAPLETAMAEACDALARVARERVQRELAALLVAPDAPAGLALLRRTGIEATLAPGVAADAAAVVGELPADLELRLAAWLRGSEAGTILARLRFPRRTAERVARLVALHPIDRSVEPTRAASVRRLMRRADAADREGLCSLREAELRLASRSEAPRVNVARRRLAALQQTIERVSRTGAVALHRRDLALDGRAVMTLLGCGPGPWVGEALQHLTEQVLEDPTCNTPERLGALLAEWRAGGGGGTRAARPPGTRARRPATDE